jgi:tetratricopeptide (TPR) repeat protein
MRQSVIWLGIGAWLVGIAAADADPFEECRTPRAAAQRLAACSAVISGKGFSNEQKAYAYRLRGSARLDAGALDQALADISAAVRLAPRDATALLLRGQVRVGRNEISRAIGDFSEAISINPRSAAALTGRGHAHMLMGYLDAAIADLTRAIEILPDSAVGYNNRGLAYRRAGNLERAIEDYTAAINRNPIYALAYSNRGYTHEARGDRVAAVADFRQALMIDPSMAGARQGLERLGALGPLEQESTRLIADGKSFVERHCSACHAVGTIDQSPNPKAPTFRSLHRRHPVAALREPLTRGIAAQHDEMPQFVLPNSEVDAIIAYINSLAPAR